MGTVQDSLSGDEIALDNYKMSFFDLDINKAENLHEQLCIDKDQFSQSVPILPQGSDVKVIQLKDMGCDMKPSQSGAVVLQSQGVGFLCDNPVDSTDLAQVNCTQCFNKQQCLKTKNSQYFPLNRAGRVATFTLTSSTFKISLGINCKKSVGETCNRNFVFSGSYDKCAPPTTPAPTTVSKCPQTQDASIDISKSLLAVNNLGGLGPDKNTAKELRYKHAGQTTDGRMFDLVVAVAEGQSYKSIFADIRNGVSGKLGNINIDVPVTDKNNGVEMTTFVFTVQDSLSGDEIALDNYKMSFFDLDINKAENLHELLCIDKDQFSQSVPILPQGSDVKVIQLKDMGCDMKPSQSGSVFLESQGVGFLCDNPADATDLSQVDCEQCFNKQQCLK